MVDAATTAAGDVPPFDRLRAGRTRARLLRASTTTPERLRAAALALSEGERAFADEVTRLANDVVRLSDLATRVEGVLSDIATTQVLAGDVPAAVATVEAPRAWLPRPTTGSRSSNSRSTEDLLTCWIMSGQWEPVAVATACGPGCRGPDSSPAAGSPILVGAVYSHRFPCLSWYD